MSRSQKEGTKGADTRVAALVGPYQSGKTTLLEALLHRSGTLHRKGKVKDSSTLGDASPEARKRAMSTEVNIAHAAYLEESWCFLDCPGSIELAEEARSAMMVADMTIVVCEPDPAKALTVYPLLKFLDDHDMPHAIFINKIDHGGSVQAMLEALQAVSSRPLVLREVPIREGSEVVGFVDLVSERAFRYEEGKPSALINLPDSLSSREEEARSEMLERLADFDDRLLEELLEDVTPGSDEIYDNLTKDLAEDLIVPVLFGSAEQEHGLNRVLKLLRHEAPGLDRCTERLGIPDDQGAMASVFKTLNAGQQGKLSFARVWRGPLADGITLRQGRVGGLFRPFGSRLDKVEAAGPGDIVALGRLEGASTGQLLTEQGIHRVDWPAPLSPLYALALGTQSQSDEVKLTAALAKICEEDRSLVAESNSETGELILSGQGSLHLGIALDRLKNRFGIEVTTRAPATAYKETIRKGTASHARHKKQSGGHGEFGDVHLDIKPLPRGSGFVFKDSVTGGAVPRSFIPAVEAGAKEYLQAGPLGGYPMVDLVVTLTDGQHHSVDSSEMAFRKAAFAALKAGMADCQPVLLEPIQLVDILIPNESTSKVQRLISGRRGQILGFDARDGWPGWDQVTVQIPASEMHDLINDLRSQTLGLGVFTQRFDHLAEVQGRAAETAIAARKAAQ
ncbi:MAG: elongation factor G [Magnetovibrionaceae bacterium]